MQTADKLNNFNAYQGPAMNQKIALMRTSGGFSMKISSLDQVEKIKAKMKGVKDVYKQVPISKDDGSPVFCFRVFTIEPNGYTPFHKHPFEHLNYIIEGSGTIVTESGEERELKKGDFALVLPNEKHQYKNKSTSEPMLMICAVPKEYE